MRDPVGPDVPAAADAGGAAFVADLLVPRAADADVHGVRRSTLDALASAGLLGAPRVPASAQRELAELIAGCDATTWFCWVQHQSPLRVLETAEAGPNTPYVRELRESLLPGLRAGSTVAAVAFAHLRRPGPANPTATRVAGGWRLDGTLDWVTSWDIADVVMVMAQGTGQDAGSIVCAYLAAGRGDVTVAGLEPGPPLDLLAMSGTHTRPITLRGVMAPEHVIGAVIDREAWLARDAVTSADANPSAFGVARAAIAELDAVAEQRSDEAIRALAGALATECRLVRRAAYTAIDESSTAVGIRLGHRAAALDLVSRATLAVVIARAGGAMRAGYPAERRVREAMFLQVQAQTAATRGASVALLRERSRRDVRPTASP